MKGITMTELDVKTASQEDIKNYFKQFHGTSTYHRINPVLFPRLLVTDGVLAFLEKLECFWIGDIIGSVQHLFVNKPFVNVELPVWKDDKPPEEIEKKPKMKYRRSNNEQMAMILFHNGQAYGSAEYVRYYRQNIPFTDLKVDYVNFFIQPHYMPTDTIGEQIKYSVVMLPSEY